MMRTTLPLWLAILWPSATLAAPAEFTERPETAAVLQAAVIPAPGSETLHGVVDSVDERNDTVRIRLSAGRTEPFRVQDGLIFNAVRFGDPVEISVQTISGFRTIVGLSKQ